MFTFGHREGRHLCGPERHPLPGRAGPRTPIGEGARDSPAEAVMGAVDSEGLAASGTKSPGKKKIFFFKLVTTDQWEP